MKYDIQTEMQVGYVKLAASGQQTLEENLGLVSSVIEACVEHKTGKALVDIRKLLGQSGTVADFELANEAAREARGILEKAILLNDLGSHEYTSFFVTVIRNRGLNTISPVPAAHAAVLISCPEAGEGIVRNKKRLNSASIQGTSRLRWVLSQVTINPLLKKGSISLLNIFLAIMLPGRRSR